MAADKVAAESKAYVAEGYKAMKMRFPYGPGHGTDGMRANEEHIANVRDAVGDDIEIMADAYMGWDFLYAKKMVKRLEPYRLAWIEEAFLPDDLNSYAKLRQETDIPVSGGEHEYTRFGYEQMRLWTSFSRTCAVAVACRRDGAFAPLRWLLASP